ncbi:CoA transferase [uncultured Shimia sp.]|uniref:CaiB/BaiF CoA transferase family protein n=1 Tax=uncultured Shimia sp. TaxID=573152 RepID=UPI0025E7A39D|nr:CoA transferase [uncultured Shimia sp.]
MTLPLLGFTIVEMGSALAGPYCGRILADMGARVIKVEPPETGEPARSWGDVVHKGSGAMFHAVNRQKDSLAVDFTRAEDLDRLKTLIATKADAVFQNLRPGVAEKVGLGASDCQALNPKLVYCNISAFGAKGPLADAAGYEALLQAFSGIMEATGNEGGPPARVGFSVNDIGTAMWAAIGILSALLQREKTGEGCIVDASIFDTAMAWQTVSTSALLTTGREPKRTGLKGPLLAPNRAFTCADGMLMLTVGTDAQFAKLCSVLGCPELAEDARFTDNNARVTNDDLLLELLETRFITRTRHEWWRELRAVSVPASPIQTLQEALNHEHTLASGIVQQAPDAAPPLVGLPLSFDGERPAFRRSAPALGEGTDDI